MVYRSFAVSFCTIYNRVDRHFSTECIINVCRTLLGHSSIRLSHTTTATNTRAPQLDLPFSPTDSPCMSNTTVLARHVGTLTHNKRAPPANKFFSTGTHLVLAGVCWRPAPNANVVVQVALRSLPSAVAALFRALASSTTCVPATVPFAGNPNKRSSWRSLRSGTGWPVH